MKFIPSASSIAKFAVLYLIVSMVDKKFGIVDKARTTLHF